MTGKKNPPAARPNKIVRPFNLRLFATSAPQRHYSNALLPSNGIFPTVKIEIGRFVKLIVHL